MVTEGKVKEMIEAAVDQLREEMGTTVDVKLDERTKEIEEAREKLIGVAKESEGKIKDGEDRINKSIEMAKSEFARHQKFIEDIVEGCGKSMNDLQKSAEEKTKELKEATGDLQISAEEKASGLKEAAENVKK